MYNHQITYYCVEHHPEKRCRRKLIIPAIDIKDFITKLISKKYSSFGSRKFPNIICFKPHPNSPDTYIPRNCMYMKIPGISIPEKTYEELYENIIENPDYWGLKIFITRDERLKEYFEISRRKKLVDYMNSEEFIKDYFGPNGEAGKRDKNSLENFVYNLDK